MTTCTSTTSSTNSSINVAMAEIRSCGEMREKNVSLETFLQSLPKQLPLRDVRLLLRPATSAVARMPALLARPSAHCFILDIEHIRLLCYPDKVLVFSPHREITRTFLRDLSSDLQSESEVRFLKNHSIAKLYLGSRAQKTDFEHIVLESSLDNVVKKFQRHLEIIKPALDVLLHKVAEEPGTYNLRRLLAFRKSLSEFEQNVGQSLKLVRELTANDEDLVGLYLTHRDRKIDDHVDIELLLEAYCADFEEIQAEIKTFKEMIEDTNQFIGAHLDTVRNSMIRMSLFLEVGAVALGSGAVVGGVFGMNLLNGLESHPSAFYVTLGGISLVMSAIFAGTISHHNACFTLK